MYVSMILLKQNNDILEYAFGYSPDNRDGRMSINKSDVLKSEIVKYSHDNNITVSGTHSAMGKLMRIIEKGEIPEKLDYVT